MFMNHSKVPEVFGIVDDQDRVTNDSIPEGRPKSKKMVEKIVGAESNTLSLEDIQSFSLPRRIKDFDTWIGTKNLAE